MKKTPAFYTLLLALAAVSLVGLLLVPDTGELALLDAALGTILLALVAVMLAKPLIQGLREKRLAGLFPILAALVIVGGLAAMNTVDIAKDLAAGPQRLRLSDIRVEKRATLKGVFSQRYYLTGETPDGNSHRILISPKQYAAAQEGDTMNVLCYENIGRSAD